MRRRLALVGLALAACSCEAQTPLGTVSVTRGPSFERHVDERPTQSMKDDLRGLTEDR